MYMVMQAGRAAGLRSWLISRFGNVAEESERAHGYAFSSSGENRRRATVIIV
jgi:hypothetical protein